MDKRIGIEKRERNFTRKDGEKDRYMPPHERQNPKDQESGRSEDILHVYLTKLKGQTYLKV